MRESILTLAVAALLLSACSKTYTCRCTITTTDLENNQQTIDTIEAPVTTTVGKGDARSKCRQRAILTPNDNGHSTSMTCLLQD